MEHAISDALIAEAREWAFREIDTYGLPNKAMVNLSYQKGQELAKALHADSRVVALGTLLMDIKLGQANKEKRGPEHVAMGVEAARTFLEKHHIPIVVQKKVLNCVAAHHGTAPFECKEAEISANADCYRFILPTTMDVFIKDLAKREMTEQEARNFAYAKLEEKWKVLSLPQCKAELEPHYRHYKALFEAAGAKPVMK